MPSLFSIGRLRDAVVCELLRFHRPPRFSCPDGERSPLERPFSAGTDLRAIYSACNEGHDPPRARNGLAFTGRTLRCAWTEEITGPVFPVPEFLIRIGPVAPRGMCFSHHGIRTSGLFVVLVPPARPIINASFALRIGL